MLYRPWVTSFVLVIVAVQLVVLCGEESSNACENCGSMVPNEQKSNILRVALHRQGCRIQYCDENDECRHDDKIDSSSPNIGLDCSNYTLVAFQAKENSTQGRLTFALADWHVGRVRLTTSHFLVQHAKELGDLSFFMPNVKSREFFSAPVSDSQSILKVFSSQNIDDINDGKLYAITLLKNGTLGLYCYAVKVSEANMLNIEMEDFQVISGNWTDVSARNINVSRCPVCANALLHFCSDGRMDPVKIHSNISIRAAPCEERNSKLINTVHFSRDFLDDQLFLYENWRARWMNGQIFRIEAYKDGHIRNGWISLVLPVSCSGAFLLVGLILVNKYFKIHLR